MPKVKSPQSWSDVKTKLSEFDQAGLIGLLHDLYTANKDNRAYLHARLSVGGDVLMPYKITLTRWLRPDPMSDENISVAKAKKALSDYKNAVGEPAGLAELMVFYCEQAMEFCAEFGAEQERYLDALVTVFAQALQTIASLPKARRASLVDRLDIVCFAFNHLGYGLSDDLSALLGEYETNGKNNAEIG